MRRITITLLRPNTISGTAFRHKSQSSTERASVQEIFQHSFDYMSKMVNVSKKEYTKALTESTLTSFTTPKRRSLIRRQRKEQALLLGKPPPPPQQLPPTDLAYEEGVSCRRKKVQRLTSKDRVRIKVFSGIINPPSKFQYENKRKAIADARPLHPLTRVIARRNSRARENLGIIGTWEGYASLTIRKYPAGTSLRDILKVEAPMRRQVFTAEQIESSLAKAEGRAPRRLKASPAELHPEYFGSEVIGKASVQEELQRRTRRMLSTTTDKITKVYYDPHRIRSVNFLSMRNKLSMDELMFRAERAASKRKKPCNRSTELERRCYVPGLPEQSDLPTTPFAMWASEE